jgi:hypothetical protein
MKKFDELLNKGTAKLDAEKEVAKQLINTRVKTLRTFAKDIYEFIEYINKAYPKYRYNRGSYHSENYAYTELFEYSVSEMGYDLLNKDFSVKEANRWARVYLVSHVLNDRIILECDKEFNISASVGYDNDTKYFNTANELIEYVAYLIAKKGLTKQ